MYEIFQLHDQVGASPVEIARAYMGNRASEIGVGSKNITSEDERALLHGDESAAKPFIQSPSPMPSACWPGSMAQDQHGYLTPQSQRSKFGLHNFPRTPYSRTIFSKSKTRVCIIELLNYAVIHLMLFPASGMTVYATGISADHSITR